MKHFVYILTLGLIWNSCTDDQPQLCRGFSGEISIPMQSSSGDFSIFYLNQKSRGDTIQSSNQALFLPVDPGSDTMFYTFIADSLTTSFQLVYQMETDYCKNTDGLQLYFTEAYFINITDFIDFYLLSGGERRNVDSSINCGSILNENVVTPSIQIKT